MRIRMRYAAPFALAVIAAVALVGIAVAAPNGNSSSLHGQQVHPEQAAEEHLQERSADRPHARELRPPGQRTQGGYTDRAQLYFDDDGKLNPTGIPTCDKTNVSGNMTMAQAMAACGTAQGRHRARRRRSPAPTRVKGACCSSTASRTRAGQPTDLMFTRRQRRAAVHDQLREPGEQHQPATRTCSWRARSSRTRRPSEATSQGGKMLDYPNIRPRRRCR